jgi:hypothetical protein
MSALAHAMDSAAVCRRCRALLTAGNTHLTGDLRRVGVKFADLDTCDRCRPADDEAYGLACSRAAVA